MHSLIKKPKTRRVLSFFFPLYEKEKELTENKESELLVPSSRDVAEQPKEMILDTDTNGPINSLFTSPLLRTPLSGGVDVRIQLPPFTP